MPDLTFTVEGAAPVRFAAAPQLALTLGVANTPASEPVQTVMLRCQVQIDASQRHYSEDEQAALKDLFGEPARFAQTVRTLLWTQAVVTIPAFTGAARVELPLPCSQDFNIATAKLFQALKGGDVPLTLLFSGTVLYAAADGALRAAQLPLDRELHYRLPVRVVEETLAHYFPNERHVPLHKDVFDRLYRHKVRLGLPTWDATIERLLGRDGETP